MLKEIISSDSIRWCANDKFIIVETKAVDGLSWSSMEEI